MTTVAAAYAEPATVNRARQSVADPAPTEEASSGGSRAFAAVLTATRQTTMMLRTLLDRRVGQISSSRQRLQQQADAVPPRANREIDPPMKSRRSTRPESRADRELPASGRGGSDRHEASPDDQPPFVADLPREPESRAEIAESRAVPPENPSSTVAAVSEQRDSQSLAEGSGYANQERSLASPGPSSVQPPAAGPQGNSDAGASAAMPGCPAQPADGGPSPQIPVTAQPGQGSVATPQNAMVAVGSSIPDPSTATSQTGGGNSTAPELGQNGMAAKTGQATTKSGTAPAEFQPLLQQDARGRGTVEAGAAKAGMGVEEAILEPSRAESIEKLARVLRSQLGSRHSAMTLRLDPPELGSLRVEIRMQDQTLTLKFQADTQAGHHALRSQLDALRHTFEQQGVRVDQMSVEYRPQHSDSGQPSRDGSNPYSGGGSQNGYSGGFGQAQEQGRGMQESYASAGFARWSDAASPDGGSQEIPAPGAGNVPVSGVDFIA